ncbi:TetR/AcrR family transcriptional regulator [Hwanghaeella grinnelliae]|uniref:TetR/AcrR family transcriptional regulator n=1 Tax=Hwanghaeella grinnelliae TaxID=2500179 RepID=A0A3S2W356_9PROT|nr:TetR/AcrR family transcriptional regulator [Hwanghaeella grinnelliae]RVU34923.1 TetR/AcrR family transcriptional regulator [Hwanghaeella grinnelliae]
MSKNKKSDRTKAEILDAAWDLMAQRGSSVSMAEIAQAAGVTRQLVHHYFGSRGALLTALVRRADDRFEIWEGFATGMAEKDPKARLEACLDAWLAFIPKIHPVATDLIRMRATDPDAADAWKDRMGELRTFFVTLTKSIQRDGALADGWTARKAAEYIWSSCHVLYWDLLVRECGWRPADADRAIHDTIKRAILKPRS